jgi:N,N'-diacetyllegionaminate synthase
VIAEPGCTHEGRWSDMLRLLDVAHQAGASCFKPQYVSNPARMCERRHIGLDHPKREYYERAYGWNSYPIEWLELLSGLCKERGMQLACTSFLPEDVATVDPFVSIHKIASFEAEDEALIREAGSSGKPVLLSTGMLGANKEFEFAWDADVRLLHCTSAYPAPIDALNLRFIDWHCMGRGNRVLGLSDHSRNVLTGAVAVGAGSEIIEAHIRLDGTSPENPDFAAAFSPAEFKVYVENIRLAEQMMGDGIKRVQECEQWALPYRVRG